MSLHLQERKPRFKLMANPEIKQANGCYELSAVFVVDDNVMTLKTTTNDTCFIRFLELLPTEQANELMVARIFDEHKNRLI